MACIWGHFDKNIFEYYHPHPPLQWRKLIWCLNIHSIFGHCYLTYLELRPEYSRLAGSIKWLLIFCFLQSPGHQQLIYWYSNGFMEMNASLTHKEGSKYLCTLPRVESVKQLGPWTVLSIFVRWRQWNSWGREMVLVYSKGGDCETVRPVKQSWHSWLCGGYVFLVLFTF